MRYDYLFPGTDLKKFIVQNSPVYNPFPSRKSFGQLCWAGAIDRRLAVLECIQFFDHYKEYKLIMKAGVIKNSPDH
jgi:hypothetical protein